MSEKKYRACLIGMLAVVLVIGVTLYIKSHKDSEIPVEGTLVKNSMDYVDDRNGGMDWARQMKYYI